MFQDQSLKYPSWFYNSTPTSDKEVLNTDANKIIIVSDNLNSDQKIYCDLSRKFDVIIMVDYSRGLDFVITHQPTIIICGYAKQVNDSLNLCHKIKSNLFTRHLPVLVLDYSISKEFHINSLTAGADVCIKVDNTKLLIAQINNLIANRKIVKDFYLYDHTFMREMTHPTSNQYFLKKAIKIVEDNYSNPDFTTELLREKMNISRTQLFLKLKELTGCSGSDFIRRIRLLNAAILLRKQCMNVSEVTYQVGFKDPKYFGKCFKSFFGISPSTFQKDSIK